VDTLARERAEMELTRMVEKRSRHGARDPDEREELYMESVRRYHERRRQENAAAWYAHEMNLCEVHARLSEEHRIRAEQLLEEGNSPRA
jgi:hypothetical protein